MEIPEIKSNSIANVNAKARTEITDYTVMPSSTNSVTTKKKEKGKGPLLSLILPEDMPDIWTYLNSKKKEIIKYIILPNVRDVILNSFSSILGVNITLNRPSTSGSISRVSYDQRYRNVGSNNSSRSGEPIRMANPKYSIYENIGFDSAEEAEMFMGMVEDLFDDQNGYITVLQFYDIARRETSPEQNNYGWLSLASMKRIYSGGKYYIDMSWPVPLGK